VTRVLDSIPFAHEALQAGLVEDVEGEFLVGEHGKGGAAAVGDHFGRFVDGQVGVLADDRHHHVHHELKAANLAPLLHLLFPALPFAVPLIDCVWVGGFSVARFVVALASWAIQSPPPKQRRISPSSSGRLGSRLL
jgi:hypothetical protein